MRKISLTIVIAFMTFMVSRAQNVGVDVATPQQKLDIAGGLKIGNTGNGVAGSLRWNGSTFEFHDGVQWITLSADTDDQFFDVAALVGTQLRLSLDGDGVATQLIDLSSLIGTDDQQITGFSINNTTKIITLTLESGGTQTIDLTTVLAAAGTDDQQLTLTGNILAIEAGNSVDLNAVDNQQLSLSGNTLSLQDGGSVDLNAVDNQGLDLLNVSGNNLQISLDNNATVHTLDLDLVDNQQLSLSGNTLSLQNGGSVDLNAVDNQGLDILSLSGNTLQISLDNNATTSTLDLNAVDNQQLSLSGNILSLQDGGSVDLNAVDNQGLDILSLSGTTLQISLDNNATTSTLDLDPLRRQLIDGTANANNTWIRVAADAGTNNDLIRMTTAGTERLRVDNVGNVGIGTNAEVIGARLQVQVDAATGQSYPLILRNEGAVNAGGTGVGIGFNAHIGSSVPKMAIYAERTSDFTQGKMHFLLSPDADNTAPNIATDARMTILSSNGFVGIGQTLPTEQLQVQGNSLVTGRSYIGTTDAYFYRDVANRIATPDDFYVQATSGNTYLYSTNTYLGNTSGDNIRLRGNTFTWNQGIIQGDGNVGIGTTTTDHKLDVVGDVEISTLAGTGNRIVQADASGTLVVSNDLPSGDANYIWNQTTTQPSSNFRLSGIGYADGSFRAPIFYDYNNMYFWDGNAATSMRTFGNIEIGYGSASDNDYLYFDQNAEFLQWDNATGEFDFSDDLNMNNNNLWQVNDLTVQTIYDNGGDIVHFDQLTPAAMRYRFDVGSSRDIWFERLDGNHPHIRPGTAGYGFIGRVQNYWGYLYVTNEYRTNEYGLSDRRVKENITNLDSRNSLDKIMRLQGTKYDLNKETHPFLGVIESDQQEKTIRDNLGFIAQDLLEVIPEMVVLDEESGFYMVRNYEQMFPVIVEAMKEQQNQIEELRKANSGNSNNEVESLKKEIELLKSTMNQLLEERKIKN